MRGRCDLRAESGVGKNRVHGRSFPALAGGENRATALNLRKSMTWECEVLRGLEDLKSLC